MGTGRGRGFYCISRALGTDTAGGVIAAPCREPELLGLNPCVTMSAWVTLAFPLTFWSLGWSSVGWAHRDPPITLRPVPTGHTPACCTLSRHPKRLGHCHPHFTGRLRLQGSPTERLHGDTGSDHPPPPLGSPPTPRGPHPPGPVSDSECRARPPGRGHPHCTCNNRAAGRASDCSPRSGLLRIPVDGWGAEARAGVGHTVPPGSVWLAPSTWSAERPARPGAGGPGKSDTFPHPEAKPHVRPVTRGPCWGGAGRGRPVPQLGRGPCPPGN